MTRRRDSCILRSIWVFWMLRKFYGPFIVCPRTILLWNQIPRISICLETLKAILASSPHQNLSQVFYVNINTGIWEDIKSFKNPSLVEDQVYITPMTSNFQKCLSATLLSVLFPIFWISKFLIIWLRERFFVKLIKPCHHPAFKIIFKELQRLAGICISSMKFFNNISI